MARNYQNESLWQKTKYIEFRGKISKEKYEAIFQDIKENYGVAKFITRAVELYKSNPGLFEDEK